MVKTIFRFSFLSFVLGLIVSVMGCSTSNLPADLVGDFVATSKDDRAVKVVRVEWEPRADVHAFCSRHARGALNGLTGGRFHGCAFISPDNKHCLVVTDLNTSYSIFGHEVRHCFEKNFH
jgi:hypothetical protein